jgi:8-oxo-dGTP diphosphatase
VVAECVHAYPEVTVHLVALRVACEDLPSPTEHDAIRWLAPDEVRSLDWAPADVPLLDAIAAIRTDFGSPEE